jgi:hypothetical protein
MKIILKNYDKFLITIANMEHFAAILKQRTGISVQIGMAATGMEIDFGDNKVGDDILDYCETFWEAEPEQTFVQTDAPDYEAVAHYLFEILDDIDTISDLVKDNSHVYRKMVEHRIKDMWRVADCDGSTVTFVTPQSTYYDGGCTGGN